MGIFTLPMSALGADIVISKAEIPVSFNIQFGEIKKDDSGKTTHFNFRTMNITNSDQIGHWELRTWCEGDLSIKVSSALDEMCNKVAFLNTEQAKNFDLSMTNNTSERARFSFKLKAFDHNDRWLYSERKNFIW